MNWFILAILSPVFWGVENFLHKVSAKKGFNSAKISTVFGVTVCVLSLIFFFIFKEKISNWHYLLFIALLNAVAFFSSFIMRLETLKKLDGSVFFPISKTATLCIMVIISFAILRQHLTAAQIVGLLLTLLAIFLLTYTKTDKTKFSLSSGVAILTIASALFAALANFTTDRLEIHQIGTYSFSFFAYAFGFIFSHMLNKTNITKTAEPEAPKPKGKLNIYQLGIIIGVFNFLGLVFFIQALRTGPFAVVGAINNFSLLLTIGLSMLIFSEKVNMRQVSGIILAFLSLFLFKM